MIATLLLLVTIATAPDASMFVGPPQGKPLSGTALDAKTHEVAGLLRCPVCQGLSVADSPSEMAVNMKKQVGVLLARGYTQEQIIEYFERSYGQFVLLKPRFEGVNAMVWVLPFIALGIGVFVVVKTMKKRHGEPIPAVEQPADEELAPGPAQGRNGFAIGFASGAASILVIVGAIYFLNGVQTAPPQTDAAAVAQPRPDGSVQQLEEAVRKSPDDLTMRVNLARAYLDRNNLMGVFEQTKYVLAKSPDDSRALTYQSVVRMAMGQRDEAETLLQRAAKADPTFVDTWIAIAWMRAQEGRLPEAEAAIAEAVAQHPEQRDRLTAMYAQMKQQAAPIDAKSN